MQEDMMAWDTVQRKLQCCGIDGPRNWFDISNGTAAGKTFKIGSGLEAINNNVLF